MSKTIITKIKSTSDLKIDLNKLLKPLGGLGNFVKTNEKVLIKPNFNTADPYPASSAMDFLEAVIELVKLQKPSHIIMGDSCTISQKTEQVMEDLKIPEFGKRMGIGIMNFDKSEFVKKEINGQFLKSVQVPKVLYEVDKIIILPCLKTHRLARFTISLKMAVACMKKRERIALHIRNLELKIAELNLAYKPDLIIMDGRTSFITVGPEKGDTAEPNILMASTDRIALDVEAVKVLQSFKAKNKLNMDAWQLPQIKRAVELGLGVKKEEDYKLIEI